MTGLPRNLKSGAGLSEHDVERIHQGALRILAETGIVILDDAVLDLVEEAGACVDRAERRCRIPATVVEQAVARAPGAVRLYSREGEPAMDLGGGTFHARTSSGATNMLDLETGRLRKPVLNDAVRAAQLADALPHVHGVSSMAVQPSDVPIHVADLCALRATLMNTRKPVGYVCLNEHQIESALEMAAAVVGGREALRRRPILTVIAESTSPLRFSSSQMRVLRTFAAWGAPMMLHAHPMAGLTAPMTLAGEFVVMHSEVLALATISQLVRPGTPVVYGISASVPDMRTGLNLSGAVEGGLLGAGGVRLARRIGIPSVMSTGSDAHAPGAQSVMERLLTLLPPFWAGVDLVNLTTLSTKMAFSLEQLVMDETLLTLVERLGRGVTVSDETLALDLIAEVGPGGMFTDREHTAQHARAEVVVPPLALRGTRESWDAAGRPDLPASARVAARRILGEHRPPPLAESVVSQLDAILAEAEQKEGSPS